MTIEMNVERFMSDFDLTKEDLYFILKLDHRSLGPPYASMGLERCQLRLMNRIKWLEKRFWRHPQQRPITQEEEEALFGDNEYMRRLKEAYPPKPPKKRKRGRPGRIAFSLPHLQFLMGEYDLEKGEEGEEPYIKLKGKLPSRAVVKRRVEGKESKKFRWRNLVYLVWLEKRVRNGRLRYYCPGYCKGRWRDREDKLIRTNYRMHKRLLLSDVRSTKKDEFIPSSELTGVFYLGLEHQDEGLIKELEPLAKEIQNKMNEYRSKLLDSWQGPPEYDLPDGPPNSFWDFDVEEVDREYSKQLMEIAKRQLESSEETGCGRGSEQPQYRLVNPLMIIYNQ